MEEKKRLTELVRTSGCNAKLPPGDLHAVLDALPHTPDTRMIGGYETADDAFVFDLGDGRALIETVDFFPPMVDDPYIFGAIAAANAISDIYAMGAEPRTALSLMCFPSCLDLSVMKEIMTGAIDKAGEAGCTIAGGHTISDREPKFGLAVTGFAPIGKIWRNTGAKAGDAVVITKRLGTGLIMTAGKGGEADEEDFSKALEQMMLLNRYAYEAASGLDVHAATDVTGFSLLGHSSEVADGSDVTIMLDLSAIPFLSGAREAASFGFIPEGRYTNEDYLASKLLFSESVEMTDKDMLFSPETSGGLLLFMKGDDALRYIGRMDGNAWMIGRVENRRERSVYVL